jgi:hypothetical protein
MRQLERFFRSEAPSTFLKGACLNPNCAGSEAHQKGNVRLADILEPLVQSGTLAARGSAPSVSELQPSAEAAQEILRATVKLEECKKCSFHGAGANLGADDIRQRVKPWTLAWVQATFSRPDGRYFPCGGNFDRLGTSKAYAWAVVPKQ